MDKKFSIFSGILVMGGFLIGIYADVPQPLTFASTELVPEDALIGHVAGIVFYDDNTNAVHDDERVVDSMVGVALSGRDKDGREITRSTLANAQGYYEFRNVPLSNEDGYTVEITNTQAHLVSTTQSVQRVLLEKSEEVATAYFGFVEQVCTDNDRDGYAQEGGVCGGLIDCKDNTEEYVEAAFVVSIVDAQATKKAKIDDSIFVGEQKEPFGRGSIAIPLMKNSAHITDLPSSVHPNGLHIQRGIHPDKGSFVRMTLKGGKGGTRGIHAQFRFVHAQPTGSKNGPNGRLEGLTNEGHVELGDPDQDAYTLNEDGTGFVTMTVPEDTDSVTLFYEAQKSVACSAQRCHEPGFSGCSACVHPGRIDTFGDGIDQNCDGSDR